MPTDDMMNVRIVLPEGVKMSEEIQHKLQAALDASTQITTAASAKFITPFTGSISFEFRASVPRDILTKEERAQSLFFITRYQQLPIVESLILDERQGKLYLKSVDHLRYALNEYRTILMNESDVTHYRKVNATIRQKLTNQDETKDMRLIVRHEKDGDVSRRFADVLRERMRGLDEMLRLSDFDYLYNGILQHSDARFTDRFWKEYTDGSLNYIYIKHVALLPFIRTCLRWHHTILHTLTFPKMGPL